MAEIGEILINLIWMFLKGEGFEGILEGYNTSPNPQFYFFKNKNSIVIIGEGIWTLNITVENIKIQPN